MHGLSVRETLVAAYAFTFGEFGKIVGRIWLPALLLFSGSYLFIQPYLNFMAQMPDSNEILQHSSLFLSVLFFYVVAIFLYTWMATTVAEEAMHPSETVSYFRYPGFRAVVRVAGGLVALGLLALAALSVAEVCAKLVGSRSALAMLALCVVIFLAAIYFSVRLSFFLVPAAVAEGTFGISASWRLSAGHFWRLLAILLGAVLPLTLVTLIAQVFVLGPDYFLAVVGMVSNPETAEKVQLMQISRIAERFLLASGVNFFLAPFTYGLYVGPMVLAYRKLTAPAEAPAGPDAEP